MICGLLLFKFPFFEEILTRIVRLARKYCNVVPAEPIHGLRGCNLRKFRDSDLESRWNQG